MIALAIDIIEAINKILHSSDSKIASHQIAINYQFLLFS